MGRHRKVAHGTSSGQNACGASEKSSIGRFTCTCTCTCRFYHLRADGVRLSLSFFSLTQIVVGIRDLYGFISGFFFSHQKPPNEIRKTVNATRHRQYSPEYTNVHTSYDTQLHTGPRQKSPRPSGGGANLAPRLSQTRGHARGPRRPHARGPPPWPCTPHVAYPHTAVSYLTGKGRAHPTFHKNQLFCFSGLVCDGDVVCCFDAAVAGGGATLSSPPAPNSLKPNPSDVKPPADSS